MRQTENISQIKTVSVFAENIISLENLIGMRIFNAFFRFCRNKKIYVF